MMDTKDNSRILNPELREIDEMTKVASEMALLNRCRASYLQGGDQWVAFKKKFKMDEVDIQDALRYGYQTEPADLTSENIFHRMNAVIEGSLSPNIPGYQRLIGLDYRMSNLTTGDNPLIPNDLKVKLAQTTKLKNFSFRLLLRRETWEKNNRDAYRVIKSAAAQFRYYFGWDASRHAVGSLPYSVLNEFYNQTGREGYGLVMDDPGQYESVFEDSQDLLVKDRFLASTKEFDMATDLYLVALGFEPDHQVLIETGHSRGGIMLLRKKWGIQQNGRIILAPVFKHPGSTPLISRLVLGYGSHLISKLQGIGLDEDIERHVVPRLTEAYIGEGQTDLQRLHNEVYAVTDKEVSGAFITNLYKETPMPDLSRLDIDPESNVVCTFDDDVFVDRPKSRRALEKGLGNNSRIHVKMSGTHYGFAADEANLPASNYRNKNFIVDRTVRAAIHLL